MRRNDYLGLHGQGMTTLEFLGVLLMTLIVLLDPGCLQWTGRGAAVGLEPEQEDGRLQRHAQRVGNWVRNALSQVLGKYMLSENSSGTTPTATATPTATETATSTTTTAAPATSSAASGVTVPKWGQCGGIDWKGPTQCEAGTTCTKGNDYYSQCL
jgi:hypothetical protein